MNVSLYYNKRHIIVERFAILYNVSDSTNYFFIVRILFLEYIIDQFYFIVHIVLAARENKKFAFQNIIYHYQTNFTLSLYRATKTN